MPKIKPAKHAPSIDMTPMAVSYTHLDVYKRQTLEGAGGGIQIK